MVMEGSCVDAYIWIAFLVLSGLVNFGTNVRYFWSIEGKDLGFIV